MASVLRLRPSLASADGNTALTGTRMRNIRPEDIEIIGERNGIAYGQWKGGPAGTLHIEFDWRFAENFPAEVRARMEPGWKVLVAPNSRCLRDACIVGRDDDLSSRRRRRNSVRPGRRSSRRMVFSSLCWTWVAVKSPRPVMCSLITSPETMTSSRGSGLMQLSRDHTQFSRVMAHEIGHVLGIFPEQTLGVFTRYANFVDHTFEGPEAMRANGNAPCSLPVGNSRRRTSQSGHTWRRGRLRSPRTVFLCDGILPPGYGYIVSRHDRLCDSGGSRI